MLCQTIIVASLVLIGEGVLFPLKVDTFNASQLASITELRELVINDTVAEYMKDDWFLAKWLLDRDFDVKSAQKFLLEHLQWRQETKIENILSEDWADMHILFPYSRNTVDKRGHPILYFDFSHWGIGGFLSDHPNGIERLTRYFVKFLEESDADVRARRERGESVTQFTMLISIGDIGRNHLCLQCMYFYRNLAPVLLSHFPRSSENFVLVNVPYIFRTIHAFIPGNFHNYLHLYGQNEDYWKEMLLEYIAEDQIPENLINTDLPVRDNADGFLQWNKEL